ncbi:hypothetical protein LWI28_008778 [Acer negundo]|uniref:Uncharacterized protein n=1 Tax=Acer negundo TaxID=4023 RepID=A0AAD5JSL5_ACENE|nr:hypothetical protein LWI28_008778 [Acer negundo]
MVLHQSRILDCCCLWVKNSNALIQALSTNPEYLRNKASDSKEVVYYKDWQITLSRRFRALKLWLVLRSYGVVNLRNFLRSHVMMAKVFEELVGSDKRFEIVAPIYFSMVCFRVSPSVLFKNNKIYENEKAIVGENKCKWESVYESCNCWRNVCDTVRYLCEPYKGPPRDGDLEGDATTLGCHS